MKFGPLLLKGMFQLMLYNFEYLKLPFPLVPCADIHACSVSNEPIKKEHEPSYPSLVYITVGTTNISQLYF
uniref:Uncharacterized protein n=1 Tax=Ciona intestinalis TaxID=7719 RepID=H2Y087_CIOIN